MSLEGCDRPTIAVRIRPDGACRTAAPLCTAKAWLAGPTLRKHLRIMDRPWIRAKAAQSADVASVSGASGVRLRLSVSKVGLKRAQGSFIRHLLHGKGCMLRKPCQTQEAADAFCPSLLP